MISLNRKEKEQLIVDLYNSGSSYREISKEARVSLRDIKGIVDKANGVQSLSKSSQAYKMFSEGKSPTDVAIALDMREPEVMQLYKESWTLRQIYELNSIYLETKGDLGPFVKLYQLSRRAGLNSEQIVRILRLADDDLLRLERRYYNIKSEVRNLETKKASLIRIMQEYERQVSALEKSFGNYCRLCREEKNKLVNLQKKGLKAEVLVNHFENNDKEYLKIKNAAEEKVCSTLSNGGALLKLAVSSVIQSIINNPECFQLIVYDNLLPVTYNPSSYRVNTNNNWIKPYYETVLVNGAIKLYDKLSKKLIEEILNNHHLHISQSARPLL